MTKWYGGDAEGANQWYGGPGLAGFLQGFEKTVITGGAAGNHTVTGISFDPLDTILWVIHFETSGANGIDAVADLTSEFTITATDTINNTGGTDTSNDELFIAWVRSPNQAV